MSSSITQYIYKLRTHPNQDLPGIAKQFYAYATVLGKKVGQLMKSDYDEAVVATFKDAFDNGTLTGEALACLTEKHLRKLDLVGQRRNKETLVEARKIYNRALVMTEVPEKQELLYRKVVVVIAKLKALNAGNAETKQLDTIDEDDEVGQEDAVATGEEKVVHDEEKEAIVNGDAEYVPPSASKARSASKKRAPKDPNAPKAPRKRKPKEKVVADEAVADVAPAPSRERSGRVQAIAAKLNADAAKNIAEFPSPNARKKQHGAEPFSLKDDKNLAIDDFEGVLNESFDKIPYDGIGILAQHLDHWTDVSDADLKKDRQEDVADLLKNLRECGVSAWSFLALYEASEKQLVAIGKVIRSCYNNMEGGGGKSPQLLKAEFIAYLEMHKNECPSYATLLKQFSQPGSPKEQE